MTKSSIRRSSLGEQLQLYKSALIWDTRLSNKLSDYRTVEESEIDRKDMDDFRREIRGAQRCPDHIDRDRPAGLRQEENHSFLEHTQELVQVWDYFGRQTTFHGVKNIVSKERRKYSRLLWLMIVVGMAAGMLYTVAVLLIEYYEYNTVTKLDLQIYEWTIFPSVTMCNACPYKNVDDRLDSPVSRLLASQSPLLQFTLPLNLSDPETQSMLNLSILEIQNNYSFSAEELFFNAEYENVGLNISEAFELVHIIAFSVVVGGSHEKIVETDFGRCFTFNGPDYIAKFGPRLALSDGRESGLRLYVNLHQDQYFPYGDLTAGVRYTFLPAPYKSYGDEPCVDTDTVDLLHKMVNASFYSYYKCLEQCHSYKASMACSCYTHFLYVPNLRPCTIGEAVSCFMTAKEKMTAADCDCPRSCSLTRYDSTMSASQIPSRVSAELLRHLVNVSSAAELRYQNLLPGNDVLGENYLEIRVFLDTMMLRHERHESQYTFSSIFAFLGGQMGFFIGASLITLAELLEAILFSGYIFFHTKLMRMGHLISTTPTAPSSTTKAKEVKISAWK